MTVTVYTVGHSTRTIDDFAVLLEAFALEALIDVRAIPRSRHYPQYNEDALRSSLPAKGISYARIAGLGGLRRTTSASLNTGWDNVSFRGYADYMQTSEFTASLVQLIRVARGQRTVIMCAEAVPWRCHRRLIGDALIVRGLRVEDIMTTSSSPAHRLTPFARVDAKALSYPRCAGGVRGSQCDARSDARALGVAGADVTVRGGSGE